MLSNIITNFKEVFGNQTYYIGYDPTVNTHQTATSRRQQNETVVLNVQHSLCNRCARLSEPTVYQLIDKTCSET
jgi:NMD protein affecting ribosome stability and mRNA decay